MTTDPGTSFPALRNGLAILRAFDGGESSLGVLDIAERTGLHKSSASRLLVALEDEGLVERDSESRRYSLGLGLAQLAGPLLGNLDIRKATRPALQSLSAQVGESAALAVWSGREAVIVEQEASTRPIAHNTPLGSRFKSAGSACVQVFLAHQSTQVARQGIVERRFPLPLGMDVEAYLALLDEGLPCGVFVNDCLTEPDAIGVASPVFDHRHEVVGAILVAAPAYRTDDATLHAIREAVMASGASASQRLGHA